MEEHLTKLILKLTNCKNEKEELLAGIWWSNHQSNPLLISFNEINEFNRIQANEIQNTKENFISIQDFVSYVYKRKLAEDKGIETITQKHEDLKKLLDDFEQNILAAIQKFKDTILQDISPGLPYLSFCNKFFKAYCNGSFKSDEELIKNTKELIKNIIDTSTIEINKFNEKIDKDSDINQKVNQIKKVLEKIQNCIVASSNFVLKPKTESKDAEIQYGEPFGIFHNSFILKWNEHELVGNWVKDQVGTSKTFEPLFNAKDHGFAAQAFHSRCDNKGSTIVFIETTTGKRFGGYANSSWHSGNSWIKDEKCFVFSLDLKEKYLHNPGNQYSMLGYVNYGPLFGSGHIIYLCDNCNTNNSSCCSSTSSYNCGSRTNKEIAGSYNFLVKNYEVYLVK